MNTFPPDYFRRQDESSDSVFYSFPRLVVHIDDDAIASLTDLYRRLLPPQGVILDLMSSYRSHLPGDMLNSAVVGLGMNPVEMAQNPQLDQYVIHDLNLAPAMPFEDAVFDAVVCAVSVQYLTQPVAVFTQVHRVLKPGGVYIVAFSNRCFPTKAVAAWLAGNDSQHIALVTRYFEESAAWQGIETFAQTGAHDPLYAVWAYKSGLSPDQDAAQTQKRHEGGSGTRFDPVTPLD